jgi:hypothetical protein
VKPSVVAARELRWLGWAWCAAGVAALGAGLAAGSVARLGTLEAAASVLVFGLSVGGSLGGLLLGVRTPPPILYLRIFDIAPEPPPHARGEAPRTTALRAVAAALAEVLPLMLLSALALAVTLLLIGEPQDELPDQLAQITAFVTGGWLLVAATIALRVAAWVTRWERLRGKVLICPPLHSGRLSHVYYAAAPADAGARRGRWRGAVGG